MGYQDNPRYQRWVAKLQSMPPEQRAVLSTVQADEYFASNEMKRQLQMMEAASRKKGHEDDLELRQGQLDLAQSSAATDQAQAQTGLDQGGQRLELLQGRMDRSADLTRQNLDNATQRLGMSSRRLDQSRDAFDARQDDISAANTLGMVNLGLSAPLAYMDYKRSAEQADAVDDYIRKLQSQTRGLLSGRY